MSKKELLAKLLDKFSEEELEELLGEDETESTEASTNTHVIHKNRQSNRRRGSGKSKNGMVTRKKKRAKKKSSGRSRACRTESMNTSRKRPNKFNDLIENAQLDVDEKKELAEAAKADKQSQKDRIKLKKNSRKSSLVDVVCRVCGGEDSVSAAIITDVNRYKCNECSTSACD